MADNECDHELLALGAEAAEHLKQISWKNAKWVIRFLPERFPLVKNYRMPIVYLWFF